MERKYKLMQDGRKAVRDEKASLSKRSKFNINKVA